MDTREYILSGVVAIGTSVSTFFAVRKSRDDSLLGKTGQALETWQNLAESNKENWDSCEAKCERLNQRIDKQEEEIDKLRADNFLIQVQMNTLQMQIAGKMNLHEPPKHD